MKIGFAPQLTLEAAILMRGGFEGLGSMIPARALYLKLGGANGGIERDAAGAKAAVAALAEQHLAELEDAARRSSRSQTTPYLSRPMPKFASRYLGLRSSRAGQGMVG